MLIAMMSNSYQSISVNNDRLADRQDFQLIVYLDILKLFHKYDMKLSPIETITTKLDLDFWTCNFLSLRSLLPQNVFLWEDYPVAFPFSYFS